MINIIRCLNRIKESVYDDVAKKLIKEAKNPFAPYLISIFNSCIEKGQHLYELKIATPLQKRGFKTDLKNYWSISILSSLKRSLK